jgi:DNA mismatch repair protein MutL
MRRLDGETVDRIAAGEVVTRPARVVAELVENALDAGAERVEVGVEAGGTEEIRVGDDGAGMSPAEAELAVERHTTSKLSDGDLSAVDTLGFRGEALASIAEAATLDLTTNDGGQRGARVRIEDGEKTVETAGRGRGTTVVVTDLFADRPARRASMAAPATEFERISDLVADYALLRPEVGFVLDHDGQRTFTTPGSGDVADAALAVYGRDVARESTTVDAVAEVDLGDEGTAAIRTEGLLAYPSITRTSRNHVHVAVDGRPVSMPSLRRAVERGYGSLVPGDRHPVAAVGVSLPTGAVDPNVHPAKARVALRGADAVEAAIEDAVATALSTADLRRSAAVEMDLDAALAPLDAGDAHTEAFADWEVIGRFRDTYVLCAAGDELLVVDQHAAHERINYERLREAVGEEVPSVPLDPPSTLSLSPGEAAAVETHADALERVGFDCDPFGGGTVRVRSTPAPLGRTAAPEALREVLAALRGGESPDLREDLLAELACHPSLKAGDDLTDGEAATLVERLGACEQPFACPHGRPTVLALDERHLAQGFERHPRRG